MAEVDIKYRGNSIATMNASGAKTLGTEGKYCDSDIVVEYTQPAQAVIESNKNATPSETAQEITPSSGYDAMAKVTVGAVSSSYVGTAIPRKAIADLSTSGATVTAPAGYYAENASKSISNATVKSSTNVTVNPTLTVDYSTGEITASVSKTQSVSVVTSAGYAPVTSHDVVMSGNAATQLITHDSSDLTISGATVTAPDGYYPNSASATVPSATWKSASTVAVVPTITVSSSGLITADCAGWTSCYPLSASGYADSSTAANLQLAGTKTHQLTAQAATTYHPSTTDQTIASEKYLTGAQTIKAVTTTNLTAANIKSGVVVEVGDSTDSDCVASVTGTYNGSSAWTLLGSTTLTVSTTSTSQTDAGSLSIGSAAWNKDKIIYVRIRDKAGPRAGYFYGSDAWFGTNYQAANNSTSTLTAAARHGLNYSSNNTWMGAAASYGVYGYSINSEGKVVIRKRYNSSNTNTINGNFLVQVYSIDFPDGKSPFNTGVIS